MSNDRAALDMYRELFERSADAILIIEDERFIDCNEATVRMLHAQNREQVLQTHPSELSPPVQPDGQASREKANAMIAAAMKTGNHRFEWVHRRVDGEDFPVEVLLTTVAHGRRRIHVVWRDISGRKRLEQELRQAQKLEALGKLAGGVAHDFNNLLVAVLCNAELLSSEYPDDSVVLNHASEIRRAGKRAADLVRQLMLFGRKEVVTTRVFELSTLLKDSSTMLASLVQDDVELDIQVGTESLRVDADFAQLQQVLLNLATNARDAMPGGGRLNMRLRRVHFDGDEIGGTGVAAGEYAELSVSDTGEGMDAETMRHAFDPFFTTKQIGKGTGLGLATVHGVVKRAGGSVSVYSTPGHGTTFRILLPLVEAPLGDVARHDSQTPLGGDETILVVEDEKAVSDVVMRVLELAGYRAMLAKDGKEALARCSDTPSIACVLSDVIMPGISGPELLRTLAERGEARPAILMSGYTGDSIARSGGLPAGVEVLEKPFAPRELLQRVRSVLDR